MENGNLNEGETILITGPTTGVVEYTTEEIRVDLKITKSALQGEFCSIKIKDILRRSDKVYKWVDASEIKKQ